MIAGSINKPTPINPPGTFIYYYYIFLLLLYVLKEIINKKKIINYIFTAYNNSFYSANKETILDFIGVIFYIFPLASFSICPGLISTSSPTFKTPYKIDPPQTPPFKVWYSSPGLLTSKDLYHIYFFIN